MPVIHLETIINAPVETCFNLSRSIDLHSESTRRTGEKAIAGRTTGLIALNETVTWRAKHLGVWQTLTSKITAFDYPNMFVDEMVKGAFAAIHHEHQFKAVDKGTLMADIFSFKTPFGILGELVNTIFLINYMRRFLEERNLVIKWYAENEPGRFL